MEEKDSYSSDETAQIVVALFNAYTLPPDDAGEDKKYERFIPRNILSAYVVDAVYEGNLPGTRDSYSPEEVVQIYKSYFKAYGIKPVTRQAIWLYKEIIPLNVLNSLVRLNSIINEHNWGRRENLEARAKEEGHFEELLRFMKVIT